MSADEGRARVERVPGEILTGGNHLANVLIGRLGPVFSTMYPPTTAAAVVLDEVGAGDTYDVWCCWAAIMRAREAPDFASHRHPLPEAASNERVPPNGGYLQGYKDGCAAASRAPVERIPRGNKMKRYQCVTVYNMGKFDRAEMVEREDGPYVLYSDCAFVIPRPDLVGQLASKAEALITLVCGHELTDEEGRVVGELNDALDAVAESAPKREPPDVVSCIKDLVAEPVYEGGAMANGISVRFLARLTILQGEAGLIPTDGPLYKESEAMFRESSAPKKDIPPNGLTQEQQPEPTAWDIKYVPKLFCWHVEAIDPLDAGIYVTQFSGPFAESRARAYMAWMNAAAESPAPKEQSHA